MIWFALSWSETWNCCEKLMTRVQTSALGDVIWKNVLQIVDRGAPKPRFWKGPDQLLLAGPSENDQPPAEIWENELLCWSQKLQKFHWLFAQIDILQQKLIKFWSRDTLICDNALGSGSPTPPGVEFWRTRIRFYSASHRKTSAATTVWNCRVVTLRRKIKGLK